MLQRAYITVGLATLSWNIFSNFLKDTRGTASFSLQIPKAEGEVQKPEPWSKANANANANTNAIAISPTQWLYALCAPLSCTVPGFSLLSGGQNSVYLIRPLRGLIGTREELRLTPVRTV